MEIILGILSALLFIALVTTGLFARAWLILDKKSKKWETEKKSEFLEISRQKVVPIKKTALLDIKEIMVSLFRKSNDISSRESGKKIILAIDEGLGDNISFRVVK